MSLQWLVLESSETFISRSTPDPYLRISQASMYVFMYVCMYACMYVCMYVCMYACMYLTLKNCGNLQYYLI